MEAGTLLDRDEAITAVERVLSGSYDGDEAAAWIALVERSLGLDVGKLVALVFYPDASGAPDDASAEELISLASRDGLSSSLRRGIAKDGPHDEPDFVLDAVWP